MKIYSVINMDIVGSRNLINRIFIQEELIKYFNILSLKYKEILVAPIKFTLGDEWQIVLDNPEFCYHIYNEIRIFLRRFSIKTYCGIGIGTISTAEYTSSTMMDGEAFILARESLNSVKDRNFDEIHSTSNKVYLKGYDKSYENNEKVSEVAATLDGPTYSSIGVSLDLILNTLIENNESIFEKITDKQFEAIELYEEYKSYSKIIDANKANSKSSISQRLNKAEYFLFVHNKKIIGELLKKYSQSF